MSRIEEELDPRPLPPCLPPLSSSVIICNESESQPLVIAMRSLHDHALAGFFFLGFAAGAACINRTWQGGDVR